MKERVNRKNAIESTVFKVSWISRYVSEYLDIAHINIALTDMTHTDMTYTDIAYVYM